MANEWWPYLEEDYTIDTANETQGNITVNEWADQILKPENLGMDRTNIDKTRIMWDASWGDDNGNRYLLQRHDRGENTDYYLIVQGQFDRRGTVTFYYRAGQAGAQVMDTSSSENTYSAKTLVNEQLMISNLATSKVEIPQKALSISDVLFWDSVCHIIAENQNVVNAISQSLGTPVNTPHDKTYSKTEKVIRNIEPSIAPALLNRIINYALDDYRKKIKPAF